MLPVLRELRPHLTEESFAEVYDNGYPQGLRFLAAYVADDCVGVAGWRILHTTALIKKLYVDDLVTKESERSRGVGAALLGELTTRAKSNGCMAIDLDSGVHRSDAHRFYMREGMKISSFHFFCALDS